MFYFIIHGRQTELHAAGSSVGCDFAVQLYADPQALFAFVRSSHSAPLLAYLVGMVRRRIHGTALSRICIHSRNSTVALIFFHFRT